LFLDDALDALDTGRGTYRGRYSTPSRAATTRPPCVEYRFPSHVAVADMSSPLLSGSFGSGGSSIVMVRL